MATGHIRRTAPINQDPTRSGVSPLMDACKDTFIHRDLSRTVLFPAWIVAEPAVPRSQSVRRLLCLRGRGTLVIQETLSRLERNEGHFPEVAIREAIAHRNEIIPPLLEVLEAVARGPRSFAGDRDRMIHIYAMYLLAQFRETRTYLLLVQIFSAPGELPMDLAGHVVTEDLGSILASVSDGNVSGMT